MMKPIWFGDYNSAYIHQSPMKRQYITYKTSKYITKIKVNLNSIYLQNIAAFLFIFLLFSCQQKPSNETIDRYALVNRHNITVEQFDSLSSLTVGNGNFAFTTDITGLQTFYTEYGNGVSLGTMSNWNWPHTWGWNYPMVAMCATCLNEPEIALEALLKDVQKNTYLVNGHNYQDERLRIYLPGNGGFLKKIALMCAGWESCTEKNPGFPKDENWVVKWENLVPNF